MRERHMPRARTILTSLCTVAALAGVPFTVAAQATAPTVPAAKGMVADVKVTGEVTDVDRANRLLAVKGPNGGINVYSVGPEIKRFDEIKVGDRIVVEYTAAVAVALRKGGEDIREKVEAESGAIAPPSSPPGATAMRRTTIVANVEKVDRAKSIATLRGPKGRVADVKVEDPAVLKEIKTGDKVVAVIYESAAISVRPAPVPAAKK